MCKANDIYIPVLVGDEREEMREREQQDPEGAPAHQHDDDDHEEECDVITWMILLVGLLLLIATAFMPCACEVVHGLETQTSALLRGAAKILPHQSETEKTPESPLVADFQERPWRIKENIAIVEESVSNESIEEDSTEPSERESDEQFHVWSGLPELDSSDVSASDENYSGLPRDEDFEFEMVHVTEVNDDELPDQEEEATTQRSIAPKQAIFSSEMVNHVFILKSASGEVSELMESQAASPSKRKESGEASASHKIPDDSSAKAKQTRSDDAASKRGSISFDEVFQSAPGDDDEVIIEEPAKGRRSLDKTS